MGRASPTRPDVVRFTDRGLGNDSYLLGWDASALVVDPVRDIEAYVAETERRGLRVEAVLETHLHADFVSGARELAALGAEIYASVEGDLAFPHTALRDGDPVESDGLRMRALATPGHTPEHLGYLVESEPPMLFSGGALLPGWAARTDLLGPQRTEDLARALYRTLHERLAELPDETVVHPTHGSGSLCAAPGVSAERSTTMGAERRTNPLLAPRPEDDFVEVLVAGFGPYPPYFLRLRDVNQRGPSVLGGTPTPLELAPADVSRELDMAAIALDVRPIEEYAAGHLRGSVAIPLGGPFAVWLGWVVLWGSRLVLVADEAEQAREAAIRAAGIGFEDVAGWARLDRLAEAGLPVAETEVLDSRGLEQRLASPSPPAVVDVRRSDEVARGLVPGALHVELGRFADGVPEAVPRGPVVTYCVGGGRAITAASLLERAGVGPLAVMPGGASRWQESGRALEGP